MSSHESGDDIPETEAGFPYTGVYGDHSTRGWNDWYLDYYNARKRAQGGYTPASNALVDLTYEIEGETPVEEAERKQAAIQKAGILAAAEARSKGYTINGWESEEAALELRLFYDSYAQDFAAAEAAKEARSKGIEINGDFSEPDIQTS